MKLMCDIDHRKMNAHCSLRVRRIKIEISKFDERAQKFGPTDDAFNVDKLISSGGKMDIVFGYEVGT